MKFDYKMVFKFLEDEIDDFVYFVCIGDDVDLIELLFSLVECESVILVEILFVVKDEGKLMILYMVIGNGYVGEC